MYVLACELWIVTQYGHGEWNNSLQHILFRRNIIASILKYSTEYLIYLIHYHSYKHFYNTCMRHKDYMLHRY